MKRITLAALSILALCAAVAPNATALNERFEKERRETLDSSLNQQLQQQSHGMLAGLSQRHKESFRENLNSALPQTPSSLSTVASAQAQGDRQNLLLPSGKGILLG